MRRMLLIGMILSFGMFAMAQQAKVSVPKNFKDYGVIKPANNAIDNPVHFTTKKANSTVKAGAIPSETPIGETKYDLQTNGCTQNRIFAYPDGTIGATWTFGMLDAGASYTDRGTGYNYFDGTSWGAYPTARLENIRAGWPSYTAWGPAGEAVLTHSGATNLILNTRTTKGTGAWTQTLVGNNMGRDMLWPRMIAGGTNHNTLHLIALTEQETSTSNGTLYQGMNGALLYSRSTDGGQTWNPQHLQLPGMDSTSFWGIGGDSYVWGDAKGDTIAFLVADSWHDFIMMKSNDNGTTWTKTVIWECPYPLFDALNPITTDTFYCPDGAMHLAFDAQGMAHVVFGVNRAAAGDDGAGGIGTFYYPYVDGIAYWNESMGTFTSNNFKYTLDPDSLYAQGKILAWVQDINGNDSIDYLYDPGPGGDLLRIGKYFISPSSMPQLHIDRNGVFFLVYTSIIENRKSSSNQFYRHVWARMNENIACDTCWGDFIDLTGSIVHNYDECVFPSLASYSNNSIHFIYQADEEPGLSVRGDEDGVTMNTIQYSATPKSDLGLGMQEVPRNIAFVSQNYPNPFNNTSEVTVNLSNSTNLKLEVFTITGQKVYEVSKGRVSAGYHNFTIDGSRLNSGMYFYTVTAGTQSVTKKMMVN